MAINDLLPEDLQADPEVLDASISQRAFLAIMIFLETLKTGVGDSFMEPEPTVGERDPNAFYNRVKEVAAAFSAPGATPDPNAYFKAVKALSDAWADPADADAALTALKAAAAALQTIATEAPAITAALTAIAASLDAINTNTANSAVSLATIATKPLT